MSQGQKSKAEAKRLSALLNEKSVKWKEIKAILQTQNSSSAAFDSLRRQALKRACLDPSPSMCKHTFKLLLQKTNLDHGQRVRYALLAVRCQNLNALTTLIYDNVSILYHARNGVDSFSCSNGNGNSTSTSTSNGNGNGNFNANDNANSTLLHLVCEKHGWNAEVQFILKETLENRDHDNAHEGMFECQPMIPQFVEMPLTLSMQAGSDLDEIISHLREEYPIYFANHIHCLSKIVAEYCCDLSLYHTLLRDYPQLLMLQSTHTRTRTLTPLTRTRKEEDRGWTPLHDACFYQNRDMIQMLLQEYKTREGRKVLKGRMLLVNAAFMSPLGYLLLNVGDRDSQNVWSCIRVCIDFFEDLHVFHLMVEHMFDQLVSNGTSHYMRIVQQIVNRLDIDLCGLDQDGKSVLGILVVKMAQCKDKKNRAVSKNLLQFVLSNSSSSSGRGRNPAEVRDGQCRLPIHWACETGLSWELGLESIVRSNIFALDECDPLSPGVLPFALVASNSRVDLNSVYHMLRYNPGVL